MTEQQYPHTDAIAKVIGIVALVFFAWFFFFRGDSSDVPSSQPHARTAQSYADEYGGDTARYSGILRITDCGDLQRMFNAGKANFDNNAAGVQHQWLGQMTAADDRMDALGC